MRTSGVFVLAGLLAATSATAATIGFSGNFQHDDDVMFFQYHVSNLGPVTVSTTSFGAGGFSPILTLFDASGAFQFDSIGYSTNDEASLTWNSLADELYLVALTQYDNSAIGPNVTDGFVRDGQGNFTAEPPFNPSIPGGSFLLPGPEQRTSYWAVEFTSADPTLVASEVPEPSTIALNLAGACLLAGMLAAKRRKSQPTP